MSEIGDCGLGVRAEASRNSELDDSNFGSLVLVRENFQHERNQVLIDVPRSLPAVFFRMSTHHIGLDYDRLRRNLLNNWYSSFDNTFESEEPVFLLTNHDKAFPAFRYPRRVTEGWSNFDIKGGYYLGETYTVKMPILSEVRN